MKDKKTKVLIITMDYPPPMGGIQTLTKDLYQGLKKAGINVKLLNFDGRNSSNYNKIKLIDLFYTPATKNKYYSFKKIINPFLLFNHGGYREFVFNNVVYRLSKETIDEFKPDIIHLTKADLYPAVWNNHLPFIVSCHSEELIDNFPVIYSLNHAAIIHCVTEYSKKKVLTLIHDKNNIEVIYNSVKHSLVESLSYEKKEDIIITVCRLIKRKNVDKTIQAFSLLPNEILKKYKYIIIGDGPEKKNLQRLTVALGVKDKVIFKGNVKEDEKWKLLRKSKIFVMCPTEYKKENEGFGIVYIEAQAAGLPVVGSNNGGVPEAVGKGGVIVKNELDPKEISISINNLLTNRKLFDKLIDEINKRIIHFNEDTWIQKMLVLYQNILANKIKI